MVIIARLAQLLGSNAGTAFTVPLAVLLFAVVLTPFVEKGARRAQSIRFWARARVVIGVCVGASALIGLAVWIAVKSGAIDMARYRIFGFEQTTLVNSSVESRLEILFAYFWVHLEYAPVFGNFFVDRHTTGYGSYVHSLLAILPHLGIVGAALFCGMAMAVRNQLWSAWSAGVGRPGELRFAMLSIMVTIWVATFVLLTTFFSYTLLWLILGIVSPAVIVHNPSAGSVIRGRCLRVTGVR
jgi:hypothetical protein